MSQINVNTITDEAGTGPVNFPYDFTIAGSALVIPPAHSATTVSGATQALDVGLYNFFNAGTLSADTTLSFTSVPTNALWTYTGKAGLGEGYTLAYEPVYSGLSVSVFAQDPDPYGVAFSSDGTKMYTCGANNKTIYQYTLATAWDVSTTTYDSVSFSVVAQETFPHDLTFSTDGTKMYIVGETSDTVYQYTLSTEWDLSTASYASLSKSVTAQDTLPTAIVFSPDGTKMYMLGNTGNSVYQYTLGTAWDVSTATYASLSKNAGSQETNPQGLAFSSDGTKMFILGYTNDKVHQFNLGTAWDVSTATYASLSLDVVNEMATPTGLAFSSDGTNLYVVGRTPEGVFQYKNISKPKTITVPAAVQNPPTTIFYPYSQVSYTFVTNDGGTTVKLINEAVT